MNNEFIKYISSSIPDLNEDTLSVLKESFSEIEVKKGELLLKQGQVCTDLYFISEGISRSFSVKDDKEYTTWFGFKNNFMTSYISFFSKVPSYESLEMLTNGTLYQIHSANFFDNRVSSVQIENIINHFSLLYTIQLEKRLFIIQTYSATEKYKHIINNEPHLIQYIPNKHLASYLGITTETLSRIRSSIY
ncbi:MAG: Crp/Fnr family transcriptional regulator [Bacteroidota bacterium]